MKPYLTALLSGIALIILFSLQLCLLAYEQHSQFNLLLIAFTYILVTNCSITVLTILALMLDGLTSISTGLTGLSILFLVPLSWITLKIKNDMYNKIVIPCTFMCVYLIFYNITLHIALHAPIQIGQIIWAMLQNCCALMGIWWLTDQPIHD